MNNDDVMTLCMKLASADSEEEVVNVLKEEALWDDPASWRLYGDTEGNFPTANNQQSRPEAALVEKIVNSVDARLLSECLCAGIQPESSDAPITIREAVARFFEGKEPGESGGVIAKWPTARQREEARNICVAVTGEKRKPCISVIDRGEGQTPTRIADTFLSLSRSNKLRIHFVQGKFNMGGTGALRFCGHHNLQLIITRRNPLILDKFGRANESDDHWGFTVVRRERPKPGAGQVRNSTFKYLAPVDSKANPGMGEVLSFSADSLSLMPEKDKPLQVPVRHGSFLKLYNYDMKGFRSNALRKDGLLYRLELLLPEIGLPVRVHECRGYGGHEGSHETTLVGIVARLKENHANLEDDYPTSVPFSVSGQKMRASIYAFTGRRATTYTKNEGVIFLVNGQTHGHLPRTFFSRKKVKMGRLAESLLVVVDCSDLTPDAREDLFMSSRDRLSDGELRKAIEEELEDMVAKHPGLRELRESRRSTEIAERLDDSKPLEDVVKKILKSSPSLEKLFLLGQRLSRPHRKGKGKEAGAGDGEGKGAGPFPALKHPTMFRPYGKKQGDEIKRDAGVGQRCRIKFETDVENEYFTRDDLRGAYDVEVLDGLPDGQSLDHHCNLHKGIANWSISLPEDLVQVGDVVRLQCTVRDETILDPFVTVITLNVVSARKGGGGNGGKRLERKGKGKDDGKGEGNKEGKASGSGKDSPGGLEIPTPIPVREAQWGEHGFDQYSACKVVDDGDGEQSDWTFYVNVDNIHLRTDMKQGKHDAAVLEKKFLYANVVLALALIHDDQSKTKSKGGNANLNGGGEDQNGTTIEDKVVSVSKALSPFLIPMIEVLGSISDDDVVGAAQGDTE